MKQDVRTLKPGTKTPETNPNPPNEPNLPNTQSDRLSLYRLACSAFDNRLKIWVRFAELHFPLSLPLLTPMSRRSPERFRGEGGWVRFVE